MLIKDGSVLKKKITLTLKKTIKEKNSKLSLNTCSPNPKINEEAFKPNLKLSLSTYVINIFFYII